MWVRVRDHDTRHEAGLEGGAATLFDAVFREARGASSRPERHTDSASSIVFALAVDDVDS